MSHCRTRSLCCFLPILVAGLVLCAQMASATLAANTRIDSTVVVTYNEGEGPLHATVTVWVTLVPALPNVIAGNGVTPYTTPQSTITIPCTVIASSNGPENYTLQPSIHNFSNSAGMSVSGPIDFVLGASITLSGSTQSILQLPSDGVADSSVNSLSVGDTIMINGESRVITAITDPTAGIATLTLDQPLASTPDSGLLIAEAQTFIITVTSGSILVNGTDITAQIGIIVSSAAGMTTAITPSATFTSRTTLTLDKYARNLSHTQNNGQADGVRRFTINDTTNDYYLHNVTAQQGDTIEYVLVLTNPGTSAVNNCNIVDLLPGDLVAMRQKPYTNGDLWLINLNGIGQSLTWSADDDPATLDVNTLTINVGSNATATTGGSLGAGQSVSIAYQVTIRN